MTIIGDRQSGRTQMLINWFLDDTPNRMIVVATYDDAREVRRRIFDRAPCSQEQLRESVRVARDAAGSLRASRYKIGIDDYDRIDPHCVRQLLTSSIDAVVSLRVSEAS